MHSFLQLKEYVLRVALHRDQSVEKACYIISDSEDIWETGLFSFLTRLNWFSQNNDDDDLAFQFRAWEQTRVEIIKSLKSWFRQFNSCFLRTLIQTQIYRYILSIQISFYCLPSSISVFLYLSSYYQLGLELHNALVPLKVFFGHGQTTTTHKELNSIIILGALTIWELHNRCLCWGIPKFSLRNIAR